MDGAVVGDIARKGFWAIAKDTGEAVFVCTPSYAGPEWVMVKSFDGVGEPLRYRENRELKAPDKKLTPAKRRPPKFRDNSICYAALNEYHNIESAAYDYPFIEDIIIGVSCLDWDGTRGLVAENLFILLANLQVITSSLVRELTWCSDRHSRNIALALRICAEAFEVSYFPCIAITDEKGSDCFDSKVSVVNPVSL